MTYQSAAEIGECLDAVERYGIGAVVVDNCSTDGTLEVVRSRKTRVIANPENRGFAAAVNQGCSACETPLVLLLNPDTVLGSDPCILASEFDDLGVGCCQWSAAKRGRIDTGRVYGSPFSHRANTGLRSAWTEQNFALE